MMFYSPEFLPFFLIVFTLYWALPGQRLRTWVLLAASFYFYASWNHYLALLIAVCSTLDFAAARWMDASESVRARKLLLAASISMNLGLLAYFKYVNFFLDSLEAGLAAAGVSASMPTLSVILPIGISFYTFEAINYAVDVYTKRVAAERSLPRFLLFITFFPHLVAGPIVRAKDFLPQIHREKRWSWTRLQLGCEFFLLGLFKKLAVADRLAVLVDPVFADPDAYRTPAVWMAVFAYAIQIYCDFSGYTDMAIGLAHAFGYKLSKNFDMPYSARSISEFWRRWHISLSSWLRDYLFIPLGGSRGGLSATCRNLMLTMTLGGLWHGASWTFVAWGVLHGLLLVLHRLLQEAWRLWPAGKRAADSLLGAVFCTLLTFLAVSLAWVLFRSPTFEIAAGVFDQLFIPQGGKRLAMANAGVFTIFILVALAHGIGRQPWWKRGGLHAVPAPVLGAGYALALTITLILIPENTQPFIYFQF